jgi:phosphoglycolate phosphatase-like HAD superfamily hydrolase
MVGDLIFDVLAAKKAGGVAIMIERTVEKSNFNDVLKGLPEEVLSEMHESIGSKVNLQPILQPNYIIKSLCEIPPIIQAETQKIRSC